MQKTMLLLKHPTGQVRVKDQSQLNKCASYWHPKSYVYSITSHKGWAKCVLLNTKSSFPSLNWVEVTQVNSHWRRCTTIRYLWKIPLFPCIDVLRDGKVKGGHTSCSKVRQVSIVKLGNGGFAPVLYTTKGLQNAMGLTFISEVLCLHQPSWAVRNHFSTEALD